MKTTLRILVISAATLLFYGTTVADEGMWLFNNPPTKLLQQKYGFTPTPQWLERVQKSSVRFNNGGSGSFVSANGLVMTNHHVALDTLQKLSGKGKDYASDGYYAKTGDRELKAKDLELNVLQNIEDVTAQVKSAVKPEMSSEQAFAARRGAMAKIEADSEKKTGLRSDVVTLYQGGRYHLYRFKRYTDVRLVFAPEVQAAFFGGDADNFSYPRYCLDVAFFRVYENDKPAKIEHYLKWSKAGAKDGELIFVSGHPGRTSRGQTVAELKYLRDIGYPYLLQRLYRWEVLASVYSGSSAEHARKAKRFLFGLANSRKARKGGLAGLLDPQLMAHKAKEEDALRRAVAADPKLKDVGKAWDMVAQSLKIRTQNIRAYILFEAGAAFNTKLFGYARTLVRAAEEFQKPNEDRLREFTDTGKTSLQLRLFSKAPIYPDFEIVKLADSLTWLCEQAGYKNKLVQRVLGGKSPRQRAVDLVLGSKLIDVAERQRLYKGGKQAIAASKDPLILLARQIDPIARRVRKTWDTKVTEQKRQGYDLIAKARFAVQGTSNYPDATFTLRLAFGVVKGYREGGQTIPHETVFRGLYERAKAHKSQHPFDVPKRWLDRKEKLDLSVPFNFVSTVDIIGGNSGSPVINRNAEVVGLIFDGNIQSLVWDFAYTDTEARAVSVHSAGIIEALRKMYDAGDLVKEILGN